MIRFDACYQRMGRVEQRDVPQPELILENVPKWVVVLYWIQAKFPFLKISASVAGKAIAETAEARRTVFSDPEVKLPPGWSDKKFGVDKVLAAKASILDPFLLSVTVDTNHREFVKEAERQSLAQESYPPHKRGVHLYLDGYVLAGEFVEKRQVLVTIRPASELPNYDGFVGLDIGNHNSTLACLDLGSRSPNDIRVLREFNPLTQRADLVANASATSSVVHMKAIDLAVYDSKPDSLDAISWEIGAAAENACRISMNGIELAPKRQVASVDYNRLVRHKVFDRLIAGAKEIEKELPQRLPAELLACRMLQKFHEAEYGDGPVMKHARVRKFALSYPTTFSDRELSQLREAVHRGWLRCQDRSQNLSSFGDDPAAPGNLEEVNEGISLMLDEASAAAFFFLSQRILTVSGQLSRFRYLYPNGMNLLLYDCGGGTTDIALVRAMVRTKEPRKLYFTVRGRAGRRDFGGDRITEAVFLLLKFKAAQLISTTSRIPPLPAGDGLSQASLDAYRKQHHASIEQHIPTTFGANQVDRAARQERALLLWNLAERTKRLLSEARSDVDKVSIKDEEWAAMKLPKLEVQDRENLKRLSLTRQEVNGVIRADLLQTISVCNELIRSKLKWKQHTGISEEHTEPEEVHWVVAAGAACWYPLIPQLLKSELHVPFLDSNEPGLPGEEAASKENAYVKRFTIDPDNVKHAVAKGLAFVMMAKETKPGYEVDFDSDLSNRLPFEVIYHDGNGRNRILFRENAHVDSMRDRRELIPGDEPPTAEIGAGKTPGHLVYLYRKFPGDLVYSKYLAYRFTNGIQGKLTIRYDQESMLTGGSVSPFIMTNETTFEDGLCIDLTPQDAYLHPVQRGNL